MKSPGNASRISRATSSSAPSPDVVAVSVVHFFEIVQIDIQEAELVLFPVLVHILIEETAIV